MMKHCVICQKELPTPLDEFGMVQAPLCREHFHSCGSQIKRLLNDYFYTFQLPLVIEDRLKHFEPDEMGYALEDLIIEFDSNETNPKFYYKGIRL